jgi:hypothetical protein
LQQQQRDTGKQKEKETPKRGSTTTKNETMAHRYLWFRSLSALPIRHSRHLPPPVCHTELQDLTDELLQVKFPLEHTSDMWHAMDTIIQKGEYVMRGHAACIPMTLYHHHHHTMSSSSDNDSPTIHIAQMQAIVDRFQEEGMLYMDTIRRRRHAVVLYSQDESHDSTTGDDTEDSTLSSLRDSPNQVGDDCASPGPTVDMWDTLLDSMAVTATKETPTTMLTILQRVLERHEEDGGAERNTNPYTVPTILTFNAVLRGVANTPFDNNNSNDHYVRDNALQTAFGVYDEMRFHAERNAATYQYMIQVVGKFLPPSKTRGNIAYGLWTHAKRNHVASQEVLDALHQTGFSTNGDEFDKWLKENPTDTKHMPLNWRKNYKLRRYNKNDATY